MSKGYQSLHKNLGGTQQKVFEMQQKVNKVIDAYRILKNKFLQKQKIIDELKMRNSENQKIIRGLRERNQELENRGFESKSRGLEGYKRNYDEEFRSMYLMDKMEGKQNQIEQMRRNYKLNQKQKHIKNQQQPETRQNKFQLTIQKPHNYIPPTSNTLKHCKSANNFKSSHKQSHFKQEHSHNQRNSYKTPSDYRNYLNKIQQTLKKDWKNDNQSNNEEVEHYHSRKFDREAEYLVSPELKLDYSNISHSETRNRNKVEPLRKEQRKSRVLDNRSSEYEEAVLKQLRQQRERQIKMMNEMFADIDKKLEKVP